MSLSEESAKRLEQLYESRRLDRECLARVRRDNLLGWPFVTMGAIYLLMRLEIVIQEKTDEIDDLWEQGELDSFGRPINGGIGFYSGH